MSETIDGRDVYPIGVKPDGSLVLRRRWEWAMVGKIDESLYVGLSAECGTDRRMINIGSELSCSVEEAELLAGYLLDAVRKARE